ncbi:MAG: hypothetical protein ACOC4M_14125 [Promethearchaeia archaeon]
MSQQSTFGNVEFRDIEHTNDKCDKKDCPNNAVLEVFDKRNDKTLHSCSIHAREVWLEEINYTVS